MGNRQGFGRTLGFRIPKLEGSFQLGRRDVICSVVFELMVDDKHEWNTTTVRTVFPSFEAECILAIKLSGKRVTDSLYWAGEKDGEYSVRSAYKLLQGQGDEGLKASSSGSNKWVWSYIWKANVLPRLSRKKIKFINFLGMVMDYALCGRQRQKQISTFFGNADGLGRCGKKVIWRSVWR
ncbi:hypothetical protein RND81_04G050000 [Saponaria officinalis]|uniref:Uncharacterized protein n=1 Tax=Saponaria officinalis TaxID=3572 RepID=A0AAW1LD23_SAPOF